MMSDSLAGFAAGVFSIGDRPPSTSYGLLPLLPCRSPAGFCFFPCFDEKSTI